MTFDLMCNLAFTTVEWVEMAVESILYTYEYLDSLIVNSEGSRIDKGSKLDFSDDAVSDATSAATVQTAIYNDFDFKVYEDTHMKRLSLSVGVGRTALILFGVSFVFSLFGLFSVTIFCSLLIALLAFCQHMNVAYNIYDVVSTNSNSTLAFLKNAFGIKLL